MRRPAGPHRRELWEERLLASDARLAELQAEVDARDAALQVGRHCLCMCVSPAALHAPRHTNAVHARARTHAFTCTRAAPARRLPHMAAPCPEGGSAAAPAAAPRGLAAHPSPRQAAPAGCLQPRSLLPRPLAPCAPRHRSAACSASATATAAASATATAAVALATATATAAVDAALAGIGPIHTRPALALPRAIDLSSPGSALVCMRR